MAGNTRIPPAEINGISPGAIVKRMCRKMLGDVPESLGWLAPPQGAVLLVRARAQVGEVGRRATRA